MGLQHYLAILVLTLYLIELKTIRCDMGTPFVIAALTTVTTE